MIVKKTPRNQVTSLPTEKVIAAFAEGIPLMRAAPALGLPVKGPAEVAIRIHKDGLLIAKCRATGIAPSRLFVAVDPLHYPVHSRLEIEFVNSMGLTARAVRLSATVTSRSVKGVELRLDPSLR
jgi:hypothetical protein